MIESQLNWIDQQHDRMCALVTDWANTNSGSYNLDGLAKMGQLLVDQFSILQGQSTMVDLPAQTVIDAGGREIQKPLGRAIRIVKRPEAALRVLLCIHMDTVYGKEHPFQRVEPLDNDRIRGPGVTDAKGGLAIMLVALQALEQSGLAEGQLGWQVLINPDEEIGSPGSRHLLVEAAEQTHLGLLFEPTLPCGSMAGARRGSGNFTLIVRGRSAHVGRHFEEGRSAMHLLAQLIVDMTRWAERNNIILNFGRIEGGGPLNVVADLALGRFNVRVNDAAGRKRVETFLQQTIEQAGQRDGLTVDLHGGFTRPPKVLDEPSVELQRHISACGKELGMEIHWKNTGGTCDGNILSDAGLANIDTLGAAGGKIHSSDEYLELDSLTRKAKLSALLLMKLSSGQLKW